MTQHFLNENKDRSIFRKNIGRAILNKENDSFLEKWEIDLTPKEAREKYSKSYPFGVLHLDLSEAAEYLWQKKKT